MSRRVDPTELYDMLPKTDRIRGISILAHIDHGKTTLSDSLVSSNGVISSKLAGKLRYLDSTEEEQRRGITMHSSAISLLFDMEKPNAVAKSNEGNSRYLINLIDSPGHLDFSSDVSTATRLCDGALIVVDVVEGVCTQTHAVLFKALKERLRPCLILNKIDRLVVDMKLTATEGFYHLRRLIEKVNAVAFTLVNSQIRIYEENRLANPENTDILDTEKLLDEWQLNPEKGNVIFASAIDCWGFGIGKFAMSWATKLNINKNVLQKYLFGDYSLNLETKKVIKYDPHEDCYNNDKKPMFVALVLDTIWDIYTTGIVEQNSQAAANIAQEKLGIELTAREINIRDPRSTIQTIFRRWLSLSDAVLRMVVRCMPDPKEAQQLRLSTILDTKYIHRREKQFQYYVSTVPKDRVIEVEAMHNKVINRISKVQNSIMTCSSDINSDDVVVFVSKMMPVKLNELSARDNAIIKAQMRAARKAELSSDNSSNSSSSDVNDSEMIIDDLTTEVFVALGRVFSGVLTRNTRLFVLNSRHDPLGDDSLFSGPMCLDEYKNNNDGSESENEVPSCLSVTGKQVPIGSFGLYLPLGPSVIPVEEVAAGNIVGIVGLDQLLLKTATLASTWACQPLKAMTFQARPIVRVAVEPKNPLDLPRLEHGLMSLYQYDPAVEVGIDESGQHTVSCLGELHLEQCLKSLSERFAKCELIASEPLVPYRETVALFDATFQPSLPTPWCDTPGLQQITEKGKSRLTVSLGGSDTAGGGGHIAIHFSCFPLPPDIIALIETNTANTSASSNTTQSSSTFSANASTNSTSTGSSNVNVVSNLSELLTKSVWSDTYLSDYIKQTPTQSISNQLDEGNILKFLQEYDNLVQANGVDAESYDAYGNFKSVYTRLGSSSSSSNDITSHHSSAGDDRKASSHILSFGSKSILTNVLVMSPDLKIDIYSTEQPRQNGLPDQIMGSLSYFKTTTTNASVGKDIFTSIWKLLQSSIVAGFQECCNTGPIMHEPLHGVCFSIDAIEVNVQSCLRCCPSYTISDILIAFNCGGEPSSVEVSTMESSSKPSVPVTISSGQLISEVKSTLRVCMLSCPLRVVEPIYACDLQCDQSQLGPLYGVLSKRRGVVNKEDIIDGTSLFILSAHLPVSESFGFGQELLRKTSGSATAPQLIFSHWNIVNEDPFWKPQTEEELEEFGDSAAQDHNIFRVRIDEIRKRKGLPIEEKVVVNAEKQRNANRKK